MNESFFAYSLYELHNNVLNKVVALLYVVYFKKWQCNKLA